MEALKKEETIRLRNQLFPPSTPLFYRDDPIKIVKGKWQFLYDENGKRFLDCVNNVAHVGHCEERVLQAGIGQMSTLNTNLRFLHDEIINCVLNLKSLFPSPLEVVYFVNSGSEANDLALRLALSHTKRKEIITLDHGFYGHTIATNKISPYKFNLKDNGIKSKHLHVASCPDSYRGKYTDRDYTEEQLCEKYAKEVEELCAKIKPGCFISESLQSCGGQVIFPNGYLKRVWTAVKNAGGVCIADEIQTGFGRVGPWWAFQLGGNDIVPDIVTLGKPMGNGHPVAAVVTTWEIAKSFSSVQFFPTYGGNPVSCAVTNAVIRVIEEDNLRDKAVRIGKALMDKLEKLKLDHCVIGDVRGRGLFIGIDIVVNKDKREPDPSKAQQILNKMKDHSILLSTDGPFKNILKIKPPMIFNEEDANLLVSTLDHVLTHEIPKL